MSDSRRTVVEAAPWRPRPTDATLRAMYVTRGYPVDPKLRSLLAQRAARRRRAILARLAGPLRRQR